MIYYNIELPEAIGIDFVGMTEPRTEAQWYSVTRRHIVTRPDTRV